MGTSKYKLEQLGWFNFEQLIKTLLRQVIGPGLSTFSGSADQGRDASFVGTAQVFPSSPNPWNGNWIFQVKHRMYSTRGASVIRSELKACLRNEVEQIIRKYKIKCDNYIFITNCPLTADDKSEMVHSVIEDFPSINNILLLGEPDIDQLLDTSPKIVSAFPQILGFSQLKELVQWGLTQRSLTFLHTAQEEIAMFVATTPYLKAIDLLHQQHFCVLSGPPKMGKTCTAYAIAASFSAMSFEVYDLRKQRDFYDAYNRDEKQLFICDDVFGEISLRGSLKDDWTRGFVRLLRNLGTSHKLVWTAREYILKEALSSSRLKEERPTLVSTDKVTVAVDHLSRLEKAMILYNHAKAETLPTDIRKFLKGPVCLEIIDHLNYSPESIRQLCTGRLVVFSDKAAGDIGVMTDEVLSFLSRPGDAWKTAYMSAPEGEKILCLEIMASGGSIVIDKLKQRYETKSHSFNNGISSFDISLTNALGTFLRKRLTTYGKELIHFYHPSMRDLLGELIENDKNFRISYLKALKLKEISNIIKTGSSSSDESSDQHRIVVDNEDNINLLRDQLINTLLPESVVIDVAGVLSDFISIFGEKNLELPARELRNHIEYPKILWMILDTVLPHACSHEFWKKNAECDMIFIWRFLFERLRKLLPLIEDSKTPEYVPEMLRRIKEDESVEYWGLVKAAYQILPTVVEQRVNLQDRHKCRTYLAEQVQQAIVESRNHDLEEDYEDSQYWHDNFESLPEQCHDYEMLFPEDDAITSVEDIENIINNFPRLSPEPDIDFTSESSHLPSTESNSDILHIFSDL